MNDDSLPQDTWWLASLGNTLIWARLRIRPAGTAEVRELWAMMKPHGIKILHKCTAVRHALSAERANLSMAPATEVLSVQAELVRADQRFGKAEVSIRFTGRYRDRLEGVEEGFIDIWHLERDYGRADAPWHITGIETA